MNAGSGIAACAFMGFLFFAGAAEVDVCVCGVHGRSVRGRKTLRALRRRTRMLCVMMMAGVRRRF